VIGVAMKEIQRVDIIWIVSPVEHVFVGDILLIPHIYDVVLM